MNRFELGKDEHLMKVAEVAEILNISKAKVYRLIQEGELPAIRISHAVRVMPYDLNEYAKRAHTAEFEG